MNNLTPRLIDESESDNRSVKAGWYAMRRNGSLRFGPFSSRDECAAEIAQAQPEPAPRSYWPGGAIDAKSTVFAPEIQFHRSIL